jgi:hypothetical protein
LAHHDSEKTRLSPRLTPGVLSDPILLVILIYIPSYNFPLLKPSEFFLAINVLIYTFTIGKQIKIDLRGSDHWTIGHNFSFDVFNLLNDTEIEDLISFTVLHFDSWAISIPSLVVIGHALFIDETSRSDEFEETDENTSITTGLKFLLVVTRSVSLRVQSDSLLVLRFKAETISQSRGSGDSIVGGAVTLVLDRGSTVGVFFSEVIFLWGQSSIIIDFAQVKSVALAISIENIIHGILGILKHHALEEIVLTGSEGIRVSFSLSVPSSDGVFINNWSGLDVNCFLSHHEKDRGEAYKDETTNDNMVAVFVEERFLLSAAVHAGSGTFSGAGGFGWRIALSSTSGSLHMKKRYTVLG